jgi:hypothetical protein
MELKLVSFELAKALKEVDFDIECDQYYCLKTHKFPTGLLAVEERLYPFRLGMIRSACAPTLELAKMWFREKYQINIQVYQGRSTWVYYPSSPLELRLKVNLKELLFEDEYSSYEDALEAN